jgi:tetratricopeptide (TPR) repeat protein
MRWQAFVGVTLIASQAGAQPSLWDKARDPRTAKAHQALTSVERMLSRASESDFDFGLQRNFTRAALAMLELSGGGALPEPRLKLLLAQLLLDGGIGREQEARRLIEEALAQDPNSSMADKAWLWLAIASAKLGDSAREHAAYTRALEFTWEADRRATIYMNRGESKMVLSTRPASPHTIAESLQDFRRALSLATEPDIQALVLYDLGIALERTGDLPSALDAMARARAIQLGPLYRSALDLPTVFFVPAYDLFYYKALEAMAGARASGDAQERAELLERAAMSWARYLSEAEPDGHPWVANARLHRASVEKKQAEARQRLPRAAPKPVAR